MDELAVAALIEAAEGLAAVSEEVSDEARAYIDAAHARLVALAQALADGDDEAAEAAMPSTP